MVLIVVDSSLNPEVWLHPSSSWNKSFSTCHSVSAYCCFYVGRLKLGGDSWCRFQPWISKHNDCRIWPSQEPSPVEKSSDCSGKASSIEHRKSHCARPEYCLYSTIRVFAIFKTSMRVQGLVYIIDVTY